MMENTTIPKGAIVALIGGLIAFIGLFLEMIVLKFNYGYLSTEFSDSGTELLSDEGITFGKYLPLIVAILGIALAIFCAVQLIMTSKGTPIANSKIIITVVATIMLVVSIVFLVLVSTKGIIDWNSFGLGQEGTDLLKDLSELKIGAGGWMLLAGSIVSVVGGVVSFYEEKA